MVTAALRSVFAQEKASEIEARWDDLASSLAERFPRATELMIEAREDVLAHSCGEDFVYRHFPDQHWRKVWSTNLLERVNEEIKRRTRVVGAVLLEQDEHWQLEGRRMFSAESMAAIPALEELPVQPSLQDTTAC
jgi:putative transposase